MKLHIAKLESEKAKLNEELKKYKWFVATCKYEGIVGKKHCFTYDVDNLNTNLLSGMILVDDELVKETDNYDLS